MDKEVGDRVPLFVWDDLHQVHFDLSRVCVVREAEPVRDAFDVRVDHDAFVLAERVAEHDVGRLARDAR